MKFRVGFALACAVVAILYLVPTFAPNLPWVQKDRIKLGLDLQGGLHIVMGINSEQALTDNMERRSASLKDDLDRSKVAYKSVTVKVNGTDPRLIADFNNPNDVQAFKDHLKKQGWDNQFRIVVDEPTQLGFGFMNDYTNSMLEKAQTQSIEVIRNRIDQFGVSEPLIQAVGKDRIQVQLPGVKDPGRAKDLIGQTAKLEFKIVDSTKSSAEIEALIRDAEKAGTVKAQKEYSVFGEYVEALNKALHEKLPTDTEIAFQRIDRRAKAEGAGKAAEVTLPFLVTKDAKVTGQDVQDAFVSQGENQEWVVSLQFFPTAHKTWEDLTGASIGKLLAIVLDGTVVSAPQIRSKIPGGRTQISLGSSVDANTILREAQDLSIVLRAGALPARLELREERIVGPTLGRDSIEAGVKATLYGAIAVVAFMMMYYGFSGAIANVAMLLNMALLLTVLVGLQATLTLPGIAGLALTVGMAVDGNIIIFERIREELRAGHPPEIAVHMGFDRALWTILDANVTTAITGVLLYIYGTGPIQGFAVTLLVGLATTVLTCTYISRTMFLAWLHVKKPQTLSI